MLYQSNHYDARTFLLYMDMYENDNPIGRYYNPGRGESGSFRSMTQLLLKLEQSMDEEGMPQSFQKVRTFLPLSGYTEDGGVGSQMGKKATFAVHILFRRNASWQGSVVWLDEKKTMPFRSVLELISLMHSAMHGEKERAWTEIEHAYGKAAE
ncbi:MAG: hypothetical protein Q4C06_02450 [Bacillota bacterium]|nr:hypothetical protein [Bacillota bacterium]